MLGCSSPLQHPIGSAVKNPPAIQETQQIQVRSLGPEDPLEKEMAIHSSILAWEILWTEEPGELMYMCMLSHFSCVNSLGPCAL